MSSTAWAPVPAAGAGGAGAVANGHSCVEESDGSNAEASNETDPARGGAEPNRQCGGAVGARAGGVHALVRGPGAPETDDEDTASLDSESEEEEHEQPEELPRAISMLQRDVRRGITTATFTKEASLPKLCEAALRAEMRVKNVRFGASLCFCFNCTSLALETFLGVFLHIAGCNLAELIESVGYKMMIAEAFRLGLTMFFYQCIRRPHYVTYCATVVVWLGTIAFAWLHLPLQAMRGALIQCMSTSTTDSWAAEMRTEARGYVGLQGDMMILLLSPLLVPEFWLLRWMLWGWILIVFFVLVVPLLLQSKEGLMGIAPRSYYELAVAVVALSMTNLVALRKKRNLEAQQRANLELDDKQKYVSEKMFRILCLMLPEFVALPMLKDPSALIAAHVDRASILFITFADFYETARGMTPAKLLGFLNQCFTEFDKICNGAGVTKIETVGEEYVCAVGVVPSDSELQAQVGHRGLLSKLLKAACSVQELSLPEGRSIGAVVKMGVHTGPVVAGVVGQKLPRFRLFGDTVNTAARMMQCALVGEIQFGESTSQDLPAWAEASLRGPVQMKGKGWVTTFLLRRRPRVPPLPGARSDATVAFADSGASSSSSSASSTVGSQRSPLGTNGTLPLVSRTVLDSAKPESDAFTRVLARMNSDTGDNNSADANLCACWDRCVHPAWAAFKPESEASFQRFFHAAFYRGCRQRIRVHLYGFAALSVFEVVYLLVMLRLGYRNEEAEENNGSGMNAFLQELWSLRAFLACRTASLCLVGGWLAAVQCCDWVRTGGVKVQWLMLLTICVFIMLLLVSYDSPPVAMPPEAKAYLHMAHDFPARGISANVTLLSFIPLYMLVTHVCPVRFFPSFAFPITSVVVVLTAHDVPICCNTSVLNGPLFAFILNLLGFLRLYESFLLEVGMRNRFQAKKTVQVTLNRVENVLGTLLPPMVLEDLRYHSRAGGLQHEYPSATLAQADLCGFTELASTRGPEEVVNIISNLFGLFDDLADKYAVYKVETVGDAYIAAQAAPPLALRNTPDDVLRFGLATVEATEAWSRRRGEHVSCRVGVHSGPCVGGVVGLEMWRYHLFGEVMTALEVLESTAPRGKVQASSACREAALREALEARFRAVGFELRWEPVLTTSKGHVHEYAEVGGATFIVSSLVNRTSL